VEKATVAYFKVELLSGRFLEEHRATTNISIG